MQPDEIVRKILEGRGIVSNDEIGEFLSKKPKLTYDPFLLPGMEAGTDLVLNMLSENERICVYGDYDADGICGTALLHLFLRKAALSLGSGSEIEYYIPSRTGEGYGLNKGALRIIRDQGTGLVITADCGSASADEVSYSREIGLDIIVTDHHDPDSDRVPDCIMINPKLKTAAGPDVIASEAPVITNKASVIASEAKQSSGGYPFEGLSGTGVAFKLCQALADRLGAETPLRTYLHSMVDLVCIATIADVMPLTDENRTFVKYGLPMLRKGTRPCLRELLVVSGIDPGKLDVREVAFGIAPRINALGRISDASPGVEFFLTDNEDRIREIACLMNEFNTERKAIQEECFDKCMELYTGDLDEKGVPRHLFLLLRPIGSYEGVAGIVAGKMREETGLPCAVLSESGDDISVLKGSARGGGRLNLIGLLKTHADLLVRYGGHSSAAGFSLFAENEGLLRERLSSDLRMKFLEEPDLLDEEAEAELEIDKDDITTGLAEAIDELSPFGNGNPRPLLMFTLNAKDISDLRYMGQGGKHIRFSANGLPCVFFGGAKTAFPDEGILRITGCPVINLWNGKKDLQFAVECVDVL